MLLQCSKPCEDCGTGRIMENYVLRYIKADSNLSMQAYKVLEDSSEILFKVAFFAPEINPIVPETDDMITEFHRIAAYNGDTVYNRSLATCFPYACFAEGENRFDIYCDKDYNKYSAGVSLNEIFTIHSYNVADFVKNGYVTLDEESPIAACESLIPLTQFNNEKKYLVSSYDIGLFLTVKPTDTIEYKFYFVYSDKSDFVLKDSVMFKKE
jgi:hypothetical protein